MAVLIDSSVLIDLEKKGWDVSSHIKGREDEEMFLSVISASELLHGVHRAKSAQVRTRRLAFVEAVLSGFPMIDIDLATARSHAELWSNLQKRGLMIGLHDSWLAATCLAHGLRIVTDNVREFNRVAGLQIDVWS